MIKKSVACIIIAFFISLPMIGIADKGPADMILQAEKDKSKKPKPAVFPHAKHQETISCAECHHTAKDGKQVAYSEGMEIQKCETCHFKGSGLPKKLETFKGAAHVNCKSCHKEVVAAKPELKDEFKGCLPCHPKT